MRQSFAFAVSGVLGGGTYEINCPLKCPFNTGPFQVLFRCLRPLNRGVRLKKVSFKVNKGNKFEDFAIVCLTEGVRSIPCPLKYGFHCIYYSQKLHNKNMQVFRTQRVK